jgi:hypothetical protein
MQCNCTSSSACEETMQMSSPTTPTSTIRPTPNSSTTSTLSTASTSTTTTTSSIVSVSVPVSTSLTADSSVDVGNNTTTDSAPPFPSLAHAPSIDKGIIVGVVIGAIALVVIVIVSIALYRRRRDQKSTKATAGMVPMSAPAANNQYDSVAAVLAQTRYQQNVLTSDYDVGNLPPAMH